MTKTSTGALSASSFSPSCSWRAAKIDGASAGSGEAPGGGVASGSGCPLEKPVEEPREASAVDDHASELAGQRGQQCLRDGDAPEAEATWGCATAAHRRGH